MKALESLARLSAMLARLPGVGRRSAERMAIALLRDQGTLVKDLAFALQDAATRLCVCSRCGNITPREADPCGLCTDATRDARLICVVEDPGDILTLERAGSFRGLYHALLGRLSPAKGEGVAQLRIESLLARVQRDQVREIVLALNADVESDATAAFLSEALAGTAVRITRLARGIPMGAGVAHADATTLAQAMEFRRPV